MPKQFGTYFEPFAGGAAMFFELAPRRAVLADRNVELLNCYLQVRDNLPAVMERLRSLRNSEADYYAIRRMRPRTAANRAAQFIYLVNLSFNGIYRVNFEGRFNVPYGHRSHLPPADAAVLQLASNTLQNAKLVAGDFETTVADAKAGDLVYLDPPYTVAHSNNGFVRYNDRLFSWSDQGRLARVARDLWRRGCYVVVSNAAHSTIRDLYPDFAIDEVERKSAMAATSSHRKGVSEFILASPNCFC